MDHLYRARHVALIVGALALALAVSAVSAVSAISAAVAAKPKPGRAYAGSTNEPKVAGFTPPVRFRVSSDGLHLRGFKYGSLGCFGSGGFRPGVNPYTKGSLIKVGTVPVTSDGHFSVAKVKFSYTYPGKLGATFMTTTQLSGRFVTAKRASGTISFTQRYKPKHGAGSSCGPGLRTFTATLH